MATVDANGQIMTLNSTFDGTPGILTGPGHLNVIDSAGGGMVILGGSFGYPTPTNVANNYTGGTTVLSGTLQVLNSDALPNTGVLTIAGPGSILSSTRAGTLFGNNATEQAVVVGSPGIGIASASPAADASGSPLLRSQLA